MAEEGSLAGEVKKLTEWIKSDLDEEIEFLQRWFETHAL